MNYRDTQLAEQAFTTLPMPFASYCALSECQTLIQPGTPAKKYDGCTYVHVSCPSTPLRNFAAHKQPNTGMRFE